MSEFTLKDIGVVHSPHTEPEGTPIQPRYAEEYEATVEVWPEYADGLADLAGFERIWLVHWFHRAPAPKLRVTPFRDRTERGLFATRAPCRPNPIGISTVRLLAVEGNTLRVAGADMLDGTPLLDIKPYAHDFDCYETSRDGWITASRVECTQADARFAAEKE